MVATFHKSSVKKVVAVFLLVMFAMFMYSTTGTIASADASSSDAAKMVGITPNKDEGKALIAEGKGVVYLMMAGGLVIIAGCLIIAGVKLSAAGNGQKRAEAIMWVGGALIGAFIVYKAFDLLGYAINIGAS